MDLPADVQAMLMIRAGIKRRDRDVARLAIRTAALGLPERDALRVMRRTKDSLTPTDRRFLEGLAS